MSQKVVREPGDFSGSGFALSAMEKWEEEFPGFQKLFALISENTPGIILKPLVRVFSSNLLERKLTNVQKGPFGQDNCTEKVSWSLFVINAKKKGLWRRHEVFTAKRISLQARETRANAESRWKPQVIHDGESIATVLGRMDSQQLSQATVLAAVAFREYVLPNGAADGPSKVDVTLFRIPSNLTIFGIMLDLAVHFPSQPLT